MKWAGWAAGMVGAAFGCAPARPRPPAASDQGPRLSRGEAFPQRPQAAAVPQGESATPELEAGLPRSTEMPNSRLDAEVANRRDAAGAMEKGAQPQSAALPSESGRQRADSQSDAAVEPPAAAALPAAAAAAPAALKEAALSPSAGHGPGLPPAQARGLGSATVERADAPALSSLDRDSINQLMNARLDIGAYRVQISKTRDFSAPLFDRTYDVMRDINLLDEFMAAGLAIDREAYWVRIAFIDLLNFEHPFAQPRLYGLDKKRRRDDDR